MQSTGALRGIMRGRVQNVECAIRARFISRSHARERLISRVFYDLAISPCCADFINSTSYLPYSPIPLSFPCSLLSFVRYSGYAHEFHE